MSSSIRCPWARRTDQSAGSSVVGARTAMPFLGNRPPGEWRARRGISYSRDCEQARNVDPTPRWAEPIRSRPRATIWADNIYKALRMQPGTTSESFRHPLALTFGEPAGLQAQHRAKSLANLAHLRCLVGKELGRIHRVDDHRHVYLQRQQPAVRGFGAIDAEIVEAKAFPQRAQRALMPTGEVALEFRDESGLLRALLGALAHPRLVIVNDRTIGNRNLAGVGTSVDQGDAILAELSVRSAIVGDRRGRTGRRRQERAGAVRKQRSDALRSIEHRARPGPDEVFETV